MVLRQFPPVAAALSAACIVVGVVAVAATSQAPPPLVPDPVAPPQASVTVPIVGEPVAVPAGVANEIDLTHGVLLGTVGGERLYSAVRRGTGEPCFLSLPGAAVAHATDTAATVGCDGLDALVAKGGWLIARPAAGGTRSGLVIVPTGTPTASATTPPTFTVTTFTAQRRGSTLAVSLPGGGERRYTIP